MTTFSTMGEAQTSLAENGFTYTKWDKAKGKAVTADAAHDSAVYLRDYARIAAFLCNKGEFAAALKRVSAEMWDAYIQLDPLDSQKFTRAMGVVARARGFNFQERFQLRTDVETIASKPDTAPIGILLVAGDPQLGYMLRHKLFWKDSMDARHGEHAHSLQWLALADGCPTVTRVSELYAHTADYRAPSQSDREGNRSFVLWQWLADCFPQDKASLATEKFINNETLLSASFRSPQHIMDHLMLGLPKVRADYFVATYLYNRYKNLNWLTEKEVAGKGGKTATHVTSIQGRDIKSHGREAIAKGGWEESKSSPGARFLRDKAAGAPLAVAKKYIETSFHGKAGKLYGG